MGWRPCKCVPIPECRDILTGTCAADASIYVLTVAGLTNDDCTSCATWNGTFNLKYMGGNVWESDASTSTACGHTNGDPLWRLHVVNRGGINYYELVAVGLGYTWAIHEYSGFGFDGWTCKGTNVLDRDSIAMVPNKCNGLPATLSLVPCTITCASCTGSMPTNITITVNGFGNNDCASCNTLLGKTYILSRIYPCAWEVYGTEVCSYGYTIEYLIRVTMEQVGGNTVITVEFIVWWSPSGVGTGGYPYTSTNFSWEKTITGTTIDCSATRTGFTELGALFGTDSPCNGTYPTLSMN